MNECVSDRPAHGACSDRGCREQNEDSVLLDADVGLFVVADGVGGAERGQVASRLVCETVRQAVGRRRPLKAAVRDAHAALRILAERRGWRGMASTVAAVRFEGQRYELAWVGDSRIYLWDGQLKLLTRDHSYVQNLVDAHKLAFDDADVHPGSHLITQALGSSQPRLRVGTNAGVLSAGQSLLICSDGVSGPVDPRNLQAALAATRPAADVARSLVTAAARAGGQDNASCIVLRGFGPRQVVPPVLPAVYQRFDGERWLAEAGDAGDPQSATMRLPPGMVPDPPQRLWWPLLAAGLLGAACWIALIA